MARVAFSSDLQRLTGEEGLDIAAGSYRELIDALLARYARLDRETLMGMAVAIDGEIVQDPLLEPLQEASEVHFLHRIAGG